MDVFTRQKRSRIMASIRSKNSSFERSFSKWLGALSLVAPEYHPDDIFGKPDFVFRDRKIAVFLDSCFWHGCRKHFRMPKGNREYWSEKIRRNRLRDGRVNRVLRKEGWRVFRIWEHSLKNPRSRERCQANLVNILSRSDARQ